VTSAAWLASLAADSDSHGCFLCGSTEICLHREDEAKTARVRDIPSYPEMLWRESHTKAAQRVWLVRRQWSGT
jgi:hypothetical protein